MIKLDWKNPPPIRRPEGHLWLQLEALKAAPGDWAVIGAYGSIASASAAASRLRRRENRPEGDFEFTARSSLPNGRAELFARYAPAEMNLRWL